LPNQNIPTEQRAELARIIGRLNEPLLHALQTLYRFFSSSLTYSEQRIFENADTIATYHEESQKFGAIICASMPLLNWNGYIDTLMNLGLIESVIGGGGLDDPSNFVTSAKLTSLGDQVIHLCFEVPNKPAFGRFS
jgi:hypothetical protein